MIKTLTLKNVGAMPEKTITLGKRLNIITGDNGLGKSFLLDIIWYALTRRWPFEVNERLSSGYMAQPLVPSKPASIEVKISSRVLHSDFQREIQKWSFLEDTFVPVGLVVYAHYDGSFSIWDPARNYWTPPRDGAASNRQPAYVFTSSEVWSGQSIKDGGTGKDKWLCNGLIRDWVSWQDGKNGAYEMLCTILKKLSPPDFKTMISPAASGRVFYNDPLRYPFVTMPYGPIPAIMASAGIRRILSLAYVLTWTLSEHFVACDLLGETPSNQMTFLFDEVDSHLHPKWQRQVMSGIMNVIQELFVLKTNKRRYPLFPSQPREEMINLAAEEELKGQASNAPKAKAPARSSIDCQIVSVTHSPLVMASLENIFDAKSDKWLDVDADENGKICIEERTFEKKGNAENWLTSDAFDMKSTCPIEAEEAKEQYNKLMEQKDYSKEELKRVLKKLEKYLPDTDPFWYAIDFPHPKGK